MKGLVNIHAITLSLVVTVIAREEANAFSLMVSSDNTYNWFSSPAINDSGIVSVSGSRVSGGSDLITKSGENTEILANTDGDFSSFSGTALNNSGTVAFFGGKDNGSAGVFTIDDAGVRTIADSTGELSTLITLPDIADNGTVVFGAVPDNAGSRVIGSPAVYSSRNGELIKLIDDSGEFSYFNSSSISASGAVNFVAQRDNGRGGVFSLSPNGELSTVAEASNGQFSFLSNASSSDSGIAFIAGLTSGESGVFTTSNEGYREVANTQGNFSYFLNTAFNNAGKTVFVAGLDTGETGIFTGADPVGNKVIAMGDELDGSTVTGLTFSSNGLNGAGQIAFSATLADGRSGVYKIESAPEPGETVGLIAAFGLLIGGLWQKKSRRTRKIFVR